MVHPSRLAAGAAVAGALVSGLLAGCAVPPGAQGPPGAGGPPAPAATTGHGTISGPPVTVTPPPPGQGSPPPAATLTPPPGTQALTVTVADAGRTARLRVGDTLTVELRGTASLPWEHLQDSDVFVLHPLPQLLGILQPAGTIWARFQATVPGTADLTAAWVPACLSAHPACAMPDRLFTLQVVVTAS